mgnify:CR=1 FL=1
MHLLQVTAAGHSQTGKRPQNEDAFHIDLPHGVFVVADGMGGLLAGEEASRLATLEIPKIIQQRVLEKDPPQEAVAIALEVANQKIIQQAHSDPAMQGMGTTAVVAFVVPNRVYVGNLGDSPAFLIRDGACTRLTHDHTVTDELVRKGLLTPEQAKTHPWRNRLFKYLGCVEMQELAEIHEFPPKKGDRLILVSDGVANFIAHADYVATLAAHAQPQAAAEVLTNLALARGSQDNVTCLVVALD